MFGFWWRRKNEMEEFVRFLILEIFLDVFN